MHCYYLALAFKYSPKYMDTQDQMFWITVMGAAGAAFGLIVKALSRSKCDKIEFCCIKIHRDVAIESHLDELEMNRLRQPSSPSLATI